MRSRHGADKRPWTFYVLAAFFTLFVLFLYGPMCAIYLLSFQGPNGGLTFPMHGVSLQWFAALFAQRRTGDFAGSFLRSILLAVLVLGITVVLSVMAGLAFRRRFVGATLVFYLAIASLIMKRLQTSQRHEELQGVSHTSTQVPGSGIGLCHVRRCITPGGDQRRAEGGLQAQLLLGALAGVR